jgi:DNA end-binding protein Ku
MSYNPTRQAPAPTRATSSITVAWGLLTIPLSIYTGSEASRVERKEFVDGDPEHPAGRAVIDKTTGEVVTADRIVKMAQNAKDQWVPLNDDEIAACTSPKGLAEIVSFVPSNGIWEYVPEGIDQLRPHATKGKPDPGVVRSYSLFLAAMEEADVCALIKFAVRNAARYGLITPNGDLIYVKTADQVRKPKELFTVPILPEHVQLAKQLIDQVGKGSPVITDETSKQVKAYVATKAVGDAPAKMPEVKVTPVDDILAMLMGSLDVKGVPVPD